MNKQTFLSVAILVLLAQPAHAITVSRRATITGGGAGGGKCTIEVDVDGGAAVEISGDTGLLRTLSGQPATWRRFRCSAPLPRNPVDFRFVGIDGRGSVQLVRDPRDSGGKAVVHIYDPKGGREGYTFDLQWRESGGGGRPPVPLPPMSKVIRICQDSVTNRLNRDGYPYVTFERTIPDDKPGRNDWVIGTVSGKRGFETTWFSFSCAVDFQSGRVRTIDVRRR